MFRKTSLRISDDDSYSQEIPERTLLAAVLDRAVKDLSAKEPILVQRDAIVWFLSKKKHDKCFNYQDCIEVFKLGDGQIKAVDEVVRLAIKRLDALHEYKPTGKADRA